VLAASLIGAYMSWLASLSTIALYAWGLMASFGALMFGFGLYAAGLKAGADDA